tara:strand:+ start:2120 stop:2362 length:243 start_codon:yes stop_codon:yes gene_type:complete
MAPRHGKRVMVISMIVQTVEERMLMPYYGMRIPHVDIAEIISVELMKEMAFVAKQFLVENGQRVVHCMVRMFATIAFTKQ